MTDLPHDLADLHLAPVALEVDARISELSTLEEEKLALRFGLESDEPDWSVDLRQETLLRTVERLLDLHGWSLSWDEWGIRLSHGERSLVFGVPASFSRYVAGARE